MMNQADNELLSSSPPVTAGYVRTAVRVSSTTIKDVARESGVSIGTVSNVVNGRHALVRAETRERVLQVARTLNFQPSAAARSLVQGRTHTLGVLFHTGTGTIVVDPYASLILQGVLNGAASAGYGVLLYPERWQDRKQGVRLFADRRTDGVLAIAPRLEMIAEMADLGLPLALVSVHYDPKEAGIAASDAVAAAVDVDNRAGGRIAAEHLLALGHRKIAHLFGDDFQRSAHEREAGLRSALAAAGIESPPEYRIVCDYQGDVGYAATLQLLKLPDPPTAIFAANDKLAFTCLRAARDAGVAVPEQLSVIGFDDVPSSALVTPPLTTIRQPLVNIGYAAVELLVAHLQGRRLPEAVPQPTECRLFSPELIVRGSTAPPIPSRTKVITTPISGEKQ